MGSIALGEKLNGGQLIFLSVAAVGAIWLMAELTTAYRNWSNAELDAWKHGWHSCKEGIPPNGVDYENDEECEAYYEGYWSALERKRELAAAALVTGIGALGAWLSRDKR